MKIGVISGNHCLPERAQFEQIPIGIFKNSKNSLPREKAHSNQNEDSEQKKKKFFRASAQKSVNHRFLNRRSSSNNDPSAENASILVGEETTLLKAVWGSPQFLLSARRLCSIS